MSIEEIVDTAVNISTLGMAGYKDGKFEKGFQLRAIDETIGELTGRNQSRKALFEQKDATAASIEEKRKMRMDEINRRALQEKNLSQTVEAKRKIASSNGETSTLGASDTGANNPLNDYLGLS